MTTRDALLVAAAVLLVIVAIIAGFRLGKGRQRPAETEAGAEEQQESVTEGPLLTVQLYFPGPNGLLFAESRDLPVEESLVAQVGRLLAALAEGPDSQELYPALPPDLSVGWTHLNERSVLYVDLEYSGEGEFPAWGSKHEILTVYSVVNSVLVNFPEIESVVILRNGQQQPTFAGHVDTSRPLVADPRWATTP